MHSEMRKITENYACEFENKLQAPKIAYTRMRGIAECSNLRKGTVF
jgi:hypothetical protein